MSIAISKEHTPLLLGNSLKETGVQKGRLNSREVIPILSDECTFLTRVINDVNVEERPFCCGPHTITCSVVSSITCIFTLNSVAFFCYLFFSNGYQQREKVDGWFYMAMGFAILATSSLVGKMLFESILDSRKKDIQRRAGYNRFALEMAQNKLSNTNYLKPYELAVLINKVEFRSDTLCRLFRLACLEEFQECFTYLQRQRMRSYPLCCDSHRSLIKILVSPAKLEIGELRVLIASAQPLFGEGDYEKITTLHPDLLVSMKEEKGSPSQPPVQDSVAIAIDVASK